MIIIGLTGSYCAGKDSVAQYLVKKGFIHFSLSDMLRDELKVRKQEITRDNLINLGNELRNNYGYGILAERALNKIDRAPNERYVISSIRHSSEVKTLQQRSNFFLISVDAPIPIRFKRMLDRNRENDPKTLKDFKAQEMRESQQSGPGQQLGLVRKMAKITVINEKDIHSLQEKIDSLLSDLNVKLVTRARPSKEKYYLNIAKEISSRSTCLSISFGAVLVKHDQIIATGYVGSPRKTMSCIERGYCLRRRLKIPSGHRYEICRSAHAEMNAIINAARAGVSILGGDLYLFGVRIFEGQNTTIDMHPCFICKKLIINSGLSRVICSKADGSYIIHNVDDWTREWQKKDMLDDRFQYNAKYGVSDVILPEVKKDKENLRS